MRSSLRWLDITDSAPFLHLSSIKYAWYDLPLPNPHFRCSTDHSLRLQWDSKGISAGCQDIYTVIPNSSATAQNPVTCTNVTLPPPLQVDAAVSSGAFSQYGWVPQVR
jgi:hypothetical protein